MKSPMLGLRIAEHEVPTNVGGDLMVASVRDPWGNVVWICKKMMVKE